VQSEYNIVSYLKRKPRLGRQQDELDGTLDSVTKKLKAYIGSLSDSIPQMDAFGKAVTDVFRKLEDGQSKANLSLGIAVGIYEKYAKVIQTGVEKINWLSERNKALNKSLNISSISAQTFADKLRAINVQFGDDKTFKFAANINKLTGGFATSNKMATGALGSQVKFQAYITENLQLTDEAANSYALYASGVGKSTEAALVQQNALAKVLGDAAGIDQLTAQTMITEEIAGLSADIRQQYAGLPGELETSVLKAKLLGVSLQKLYDIGKSTLEIETAVGNEIEMQLLSGRKLEVQGGKNFMAEYRKATLMSDSNKQQTLLNEMLAKEGKTLKTNFMYREKMAQSLGMSGAELMNVIEKQELLGQLGMEQYADLSFDKLKAKIEAAKLDPKKDQDSLDKLLLVSDKKTPSERSLDQIQKDISTLVREGSRGISIAGSEAASKRFSDSVKVFADQFTNKTFTDVAANLESLNIAIKSTVTPISELGTEIPKIGKVLEKFNSVLGIVDLKLPIGTTGLGESINTTQHQDAILFDPRDEVVTVASTDRGQLENTVNNMISGNTSSTTNMLTIDYAALGNSIAAAMTRVKLNINQSSNYRDTFNA